MTYTPSARPNAGDSALLSSTTSLGTSSFRNCKFWTWLMLLAPLTAMLHPSITYSSSSTSSSPIPPAWHIYASCLKMVIGNPEDFEPSPSEYAANGLVVIRGNELANMLGQDAPHMAPSILYLPETASPHSKWLPERWFTDLQSQFSEELGLHLLLTLPEEPQFMLSMTSLHGSKDIENLTIRTLDQDTAQAFAHLTKELRLSSIEEIVRETRAGSIDAVILSAFEENTADVWRHYPNVYITNKTRRSQSLALEEATWSKLDDNLRQGLESTAALMMASPLNTAPSYESILQGLPLTFAHTEWSIPSCVNRNPFPPSNGDMDEKGLRRCPPYCFTYDNLDPDDCTQEYCQDILQFGSSSKLDPDAPIEESAESVLTCPQKHSVNQ